MLSKCVDELLLRGREDWVSVWDVLDVVRNIANAGPGERERQVSLKVLRTLLESNWMTIGEVGDDGFKKWNLTSEEALNRVATKWEQYPDARQMMYDWWLDNTTKGDLRANELAKRTSAA